MTTKEVIDIFKCLAYHDLKPSEKEINNAIQTLQSKLKVGEWRPFQYDGAEFYKCSVCKETELVRTPYCPFCGAEMRWR